MEANSSVKKHPGQDASSAAIDRNQSRGIICYLRIVIAQHASRMGTQYCPACSTVLILLVAYRSGGKSQSESGATTKARRNEAGCYRQG